MSEWRNAATVGENCGLCLVWTRLTLTGEDLGWDLAWKENGEWHLASKDNEPSQAVTVAYVADLPPAPPKRLDA